MRKNENWLKDIKYLHTIYGKFLLQKSAMRFVRDQTLVGQRLVRFLWIYVIYEWSLSVVENCRHRLIHQLQKSIRSDGRKRIAPSSKKIAEMNASQQPSFVSDAEEVRW